MGKRWLVGAALLCVLVLIAVLVVTQFIDQKKKREETQTLLIPEGWRASQVYAASDKALGVSAGTTEKAAKRAELDLPEEADGNPEGYLFPATYPVNDKTTPESLLSFMVNTANTEFNANNIRHATQRNGLTVYQTVNIASVVQAEADTHEDMGKVARVIYNRLRRDMPLQMDSTINYALNRSTVNTSLADTKTNSPYNTYRHKGLTPTPIGNPGKDAVRATTDPPAGNWLFFVTVKPGDTRFTSDYKEHQKNVEEFNRVQKEAREDTSPAG
ncbi:endolytic transglycosylase MltG [Streptomyces gobiensis]|uniref:endolytic transglycosylase MltG n=1 Tax=Streptomyces gobiensis TaxID=2875706 RepID=UPI003BAE324E